MAQQLMMSMHPTVHAVDTTQREAAIGSCMQQEEANSRGSSPSSGVRPKNIRQMVNHARRDSCLKLLTTFEFDSKVIDDMTARQMVTRDKELWVKGQCGEMGEKSYASIIKKFKHATDASVPLEHIVLVSDEMQAINPRVYNGIFRCTHNM